MWLRVWHVEDGIHYPLFVHRTADNMQIADVQWKFAKFAEIIALNSRQPLHKAMQQP